MAIDLISTFSNQLVPSLILLCVAAIILALIINSLGLGKLFKGAGDVGTGVGSGTDKLLSAIAKIPEGAGAILGSFALILKRISAINSPEDESKRLQRMKNENKRKARKERYIKKIDSKTDKENKQIIVLHNKSHECQNTIRKLEQRPSKNKFFKFLRNKRIQRLTNANEAIMSKIKNREDTIKSKKEIKSDFLSYTRGI